MKTSFFHSMVNELVWLRMKLIPEEKISLLYLQGLFTVVVLLTLWRDVSTGRNSLKGPQAQALHSPELPYA